MIRSFRCKETERIAAGGLSKRIPPEIQRRAKMRLDRIDAAASLDDLRVTPSHHLETMRGNRAGQWSVRINAQWRICFVCKDGHAHSVEITEYR